MTRKELLTVIVPLAALLLWLVFYEIQTGVIPDRVVFPALIYMLIAGCIAGSKPWWSHIVAAFLLFGIALAVLFIYWNINHVALMGGGSIKLLAVVGAALGLQAGLIVLSTFFAFIGVGHLLISKIFGINLVPSTPVILAGVVLVYIIRFGVIYRKVPLTKEPT